MAAYTKIAVLSRDPRLREKRFIINLNNNLKKIKRKDFDEVNSESIISVTLIDEDDWFLYLSGNGILNYPQSRVPTLFSEMKIRPL